MREIEWVNARRSDRVGQCETERGREWEGARPAAACGRDPIRSGITFVFGAREAGQIERVTRPVMHSLFPWRESTPSMKRGVLQWTGCGDA
eukprot:365744-Chlamydomonas_euryale.AAC.11